MGSQTVVQNLASEREQCINSIALCVTHYNYFLPVHQLSVILHVIILAFFLTSLSCGQIHQCFFFHFSTVWEIKCIFLLWWWRETHPSVLLVLALFSFLYLDSWSIWNLFWYMVCDIYKTLFFPNDLPVGKQSLI